MTTSWIILANDHTQTEMKVQSQEMPLSYDQQLVETIHKILFIHTC